MHSLKWVINMLKSIYIQYNRLKTGFSCLLEVNVSSEVVMPWLRQMTHYDQVIDKKIGVKKKGRVGNPAWTSRCFLSVASYQDGSDGSYILISTFGRTSGNCQIYVIVYSNSLFPPTAAWIVCKNSFVQDSPCTKPSASAPTMVLS